MPSKANRDRNKWYRCPVCHEPTLVVRRARTGWYLECISTERCDMAELFARLEQQQEAPSSAA